MPIKDRHVSIGRIETHYLEDGSGPVVALLHGGGAGADARGNWQHLLERYAAAGFRAIAVDMLGFGETTVSDAAEFEYSQPARIAHVVDFLGAVGAREFSLIGNSLGGAVSIGVALREPRRVQHLVLMGSAGLKWPIPALAMQVIAGYDFTLEGMRRLVAALAAPEYRATEEMLRYRHEISIRPATQAAFAATMKWLKQNPPFFTDEEVASLAMPTLVVHGKNDQLVALGHGYRLLELVPNSWGAIFPHCGHWAMLEKPEEFLETTVAFLRRAS